MTSKKKQHRLRDLRIKRIDLVDQGAAVDARVTLFKRDDVAKFGALQAQPMTLQQALAAMPEDTRKLVEEALAAAAKSAQQPAPPQNQSPQQQAQQPAPQPPPQQSMPPKQEQKPMPEMTPEQMKQQEEMKKQLAEEIRKQLADEGKAEREALAKKLEAAETQAKADREAVEKMRDDQLERECVSKAAEFPRGTVGLSKAESVSILKSLRQEKPLSKELAAKLEKHFAATEELLAKSAVFTEIGSSFDGGDASPMQQLEAIAKSLKDKEPTLSSQAAFDRAAELNPKLYEAARAR